MKVKGLIAELQKYPEDLDVTTWNDHFHSSIDITVVELDGKDVLLR